jgi:hypothetical protein
MFKPIVLTCAVVLLAGWASGQIAQNTAKPTVPVLPRADFQHPYEYTPPQPSFVPNPPWTANVKADTDSSGSNPLDGALAVTGQGKLIVQYNYLPMGSSTWPWRFNNSTNAGATWTATTLLPPPNQFDNVVGGNKRDSCIALVMKAAGGGYNFYYKRSTNSGVSWSDTFHMPEAASGTFPDHPIMAYRNQNILVGYTDFGGLQYLSVVRSTNWGNTWNTSPIAVSNATGSGSAPAFAPAPSTYAYLAWGQPSGWQPTTVWFNRSTDLGATWGTPRQILAINMSSHIQSMRPTHTFPSMCVAPNGTLYLTIMHMMQGNGWDIAFMRSTDQGTTWSTPVRVNDDVATPNADQFDNWMCVDHLNRPHVFWTDNRNYYTTNLYGADIYYSYSTNGGTTWAPSERINDVTPICNTSGDFGRMGDYQQIDCDSTRVYVEWSDPNVGHTAAYVMTSARLMPSGVEEKPTGNPWVSHRVNGIELAPSRPNPVLSGTELAFELENPAQASLRIYDLSGKLVRTLVTGSLAAGSHTARWDTRDESGKPVASGVYYYRLEAGGLTATKQLVVTR